MSREDPMFQMDNTGVEGAYDPSLYEERKYFDDIQESKVDPVYFSETGPSTSDGNIVHQQDHDYETLRMKYDDLLEANRALMENNQALSNELEVWESSSGSVGKNVRELMGNKELKGVNIKFLLQMEDWKNRCLAAEDKCMNLSCKLDALRKKGSSETSNKNSTDSQSMMYFERMEQWHNKYKAAEKEKEALMARLQASLSQEKVLLDRLKNIGTGGQVQYVRNVESSKRSSIYLDNDVDVWKNYTYELRRDLEKEKNAHQRTKDELMQIRGDANEYVQAYAGKETEETYEPATKLLKVEGTDDYSLLNPKFEEL